MKSITEKGALTVIAEITNSSSPLFKIVIVVSFVAFKSVSKKEREVATAISGAEVSKIGKPLFLLGLMPQTFSKSQPSKVASIFKSLYDFCVPP